DDAETRDHQMRAPAEQTCARPIPVAAFNMSDYPQLNLQHLDLPNAVGNPCSPSPPPAGRSSGTRKGGTREERIDEGTGSPRVAVSCTLIQPVLHEAAQLEDFRAAFLNAFAARDGLPRTRDVERALQNARRQITGRPPRR